MISKGLALEEANNYRLMGLTETTPSSRILLEMSPTASRLPK